jgi:oxygen-independent coproporphyrinogen-3 oxidase
LAGIYIHIPFCRRKCHYCNFFSLASEKLKKPFINALKKEIELTREYLGVEPIKTIYFGGGTPSVYEPEVLQEILELLIPPHANSPKKEEIEQREITLELNPEDVTDSYVDALKGTWFNRFSLGIQSFFDEDLVSLNRSHSAEQAKKAVTLLQQAGFVNISIDLIYGIPTSTPERWMKNLETAFSLGVPHISAYALTVEAKTPLAWMIGKHKMPPVSDEMQVDQFKTLMKETQSNGYQQYEISNFCRPGRHAIHNTNYWNGIPYLGLGPSAHSYDGASRRWNMANLSKYIICIEKNELLYEEEVLTPVQKYNEYVMTSLRTTWGCELEQKISDFKFQISDLIRNRAATFVQQGWLTAHDGVFFLTDEGKLFADKIAGELFL